MHRNLILTKDGSHTVVVPELNATYHSVHGAIRESLHVYIAEGLYNFSAKTNGKISVFEMGFGTGLNALLTLIEAEKMNQPIHYTAIDLYPLENEKAKELNYCELLDRKDLQMLFEQLHQCDWEKDILVTPRFSLFKSLLDLQHLSKLNVRPMLIYFDAFAPSSQPELWTKQVFNTLFNLLLPGGILVTYCSKGDVRRAMQSAGFSVEKIPGPAGKREMVRAGKGILDFGCGILDL